MSTDRGLEATRAIREKISHEHGNNPRRLVEYYLKYQARFADRLRHGPGSNRGLDESAEQGAAADGAPRR
jgi:hypothetical protein